MLRAPMPKPKLSAKFYSKNESLKTLRFKSSSTRKNLPSSKPRSRISLAWTGYYN